MAWDSIKDDRLGSISVQKLSDFSMYMVNIQKYENHGKALWDFFTTYLCKCSFLNMVFEKQIHKKF